MSWSPEFFNPSVPEWCRDECKYYVTWAFGNECTYGCPYCFMGKKKYKYIPRNVSEERIIQVWYNMFKRYGSVFMSLSGLEPGRSLFLLSKLLELGHYACLTTNFSVKLEDMKELIPPEKVVINPTFHPHKDEISSFLMKAIMFRQAGYQVPVIAIVAYPPIVDRIDKWVGMIEDAGIRPNIAPMRIMSFQGKQMPEGYTQEQREILGKYCGGKVFDDQVQLRRLDLQACAAGHATATIASCGRVIRCGEDLMISESIWDDGIINFMDAPAPCPMEVCQCGNLAAYHIKKG